jgi:uncharacterized protein with von Willebrand factor type A (vWA) domain
MFDTVDALLAAVAQFFGEDEWPASFELLRAMRAAQRRAHQGRRACERHNHKAALRSDRRPRSRRESPWL